MCGNTQVGRLPDASVAHATFPYTVCCFTVQFPLFAAMAKWTRRWKSIWVPCGSNFQKFYVEEWEQEVHTPAWSISDDQLQERESHRDDSQTWFRRAHELSEQEMVACLTRADPWDESESPCELFSAQKPTKNDWSIPNGLAAIFLAALFKHKYNAEPLGLPHPCSWTAERASNVEVSGT